MAAQNSPFVEASYGWPYGSSGWNGEMDANLVKFSYLHDRNIDAIVSSLPAIVNGKAYFNTADNRLYFDANGQRYSSVTPKWFEVTLRTTGQVWLFDGTTLAIKQDHLLMTWALVQAFQLASSTRDANSAIITANIVWPNGVSGVFTTDVASTSFPGAIDAWHATYLASPTKTITQPAVTRDLNGAVTVQPAITIS